ncbi:MAG: hypothetical protein ABII12_01820 [Planctomycetota bacterium]
MEQRVWVETLQELLRHYLPPLQSSPAVNAGSLIAFIAGLCLVFRGWKSERMVVSLFAVILGAWLGYQVSRLAGTPGPISAALGAVLLTLIAYRTYKAWLAVGSVLVLFTLAVIFQLGRGDLQRYLPTFDQASARIREDGLSRLPSLQEQAAEFNPDWRNLAGQIKEKVVAQLKNLGPAGWLLPVAAAILGGLLAYWALRAFSVIWLGFVGAVITVFGVATFLCAHWPDLRTAQIAHPQIPAAVAIGLWLLGLIYQAKQVRLPKNKARQPAQDSDKS